MDASRRTPPPGVPGLRQEAGPSTIPEAVCKGVVDSRWGFGIWFGK